LIAENVEICVRIAATFALIEETFAPIDAICGQTRVSGIEIFVSLEKTDTKELHEQNCVAIGET